MAAVGDRDFSSGCRLLCSPYLCAILIANVLRLIHGKYRPLAASQCIPWDAVASFERFTITLKPGYSQGIRHL